MIAKKALISGRVQGVFYRASAKRQAEKLALTGWVRNLDSGQVEIYFCGREEAVDLMSQWLWEGPASAKVTEVVFAEAEREGLTDFQIR